MPVKPLAIVLAPPPNKPAKAVLVAILAVTSCAVLNGSKGARSNSLVTPKIPPNLAVSYPTPNALFAPQAARIPTLKTGIINAMFKGSTTPATKEPPIPALSY